MSDTSAARTAIIAAWRDTTVSTAAGVLGSTWNNVDESIGHVFSLNSPGPINRGRVPLVQLIFAGQARDRTVDEGGMSNMSFTARIAVGGVSGKTNQELAESILQAGVDATRNGLNGSDEYWEVSDDGVLPHEEGPMYHVLETVITCETTFEREH